MSERTYRREQRTVPTTGEPIVEPVVEETEHVESSGGVLGIARAWTRFTALITVMAAIVVETLVGLRLAFLAAEANAANSFVEFIYDASRPLVAPFQNIFANRALDNGGIFEPASAIAMGLFLLATMVVLWALWAATPPVRDDHYTATRRRYLVHH